MLGRRRRARARRGEEAGLPAHRRQPVDAGRRHAARWCCSPNRNGYGNLCELITLARTRARRAATCCTRDDLAAPSGDLAHLRGLPDCRDCCWSRPMASTPTRWRARPHGCAPPSASAPRLALTLLHRGPRRTPPRAGAGRRQRARPAGGRHRRRLHACALAQAAAGRIERDPPRQAGGRMRLRAVRRMPNSTCAPGCGWPSCTRPRRWPKPCGWRGAAHFSLDELRYEYPDELVPPGQTAGRLPAPGNLDRRAPALPGRHTGQGAASDRA